MIKNSFLSLILAGLIGLAPALAIAETATTTSTSTASCTESFTGYVYTESTNTCSLSSAIGCSDPFTFKTETECIDVNIKTSPKGPIFNTIQDRARANREAFLKRGKVSGQATDSNNEATEAKLKTIEDKITTLRERTILISFTNVINRVQNYNDHLAKIIDRLNTNITGLEADQKDVTAIKAKLAEAEILASTASSTLNTALASTTSAFDQTDSGEILVEVKIMINDTVVILEQEKEIIKEVIQEIKNII